MSTVDFARFAQIVDQEVHVDQQRLIVAPAAPMRVAAGAGTGKTTSMAVRVAWLVASGEVTADRVLGLTFTTKAAASLQKKVRGMLRTWHENWEGLPADELLEPQVMTYHAFAARIIAEHGVRLGIEPNVTILVNGARQRLAYDVVCRASSPTLVESGRSPVTVTQQLLALDDRLADLDITPEQLISYEDHAIALLRSGPALQRIGERMLHTSLQRRALAELVLAFREVKLARDVMDFADQTRLAGRLVAEVPEIGRHLRERSGLVLLDEYQDTSVAQRTLLQGIFTAAHSLTAVGDASQAIYGWRGASVANMTSFARHFGAREDAYTLTANFRSGPAILAVANELSRVIPGRAGDLTAGNPERGSGHVSCGLFATRADEHSWIAARLRSLGTGRQARPWGTMAVLASTGAELAAVEQVLSAADIPTQRHGAAGLLHTPAVVDLRAMLEVIHTPTANRSVVRLLAGPLWRLGPRDLAALGRRAARLAGGGHRSSSTTIDESLDAAVAGSDPAEAVSLVEAVMDPGDPGEYSPHGWERLRHFADVVRAAMRHGSEPAADVVTAVLALMGLEVEVLLSPDSERQREAIAAFVALASDFTHTQDGGSLGAFLARLADAERFDVDLPFAAGPRADAVQLMTIYKAKGLEFPYVFVPAMSKGAFPSGEGRTLWTTDPSEVPFALREDAPVMSPFPDPQRGPTATSHQAYLDEFAAHELIEARRLAYVAMTRAESFLAVTGHWWGPTQVRPRGPAPFLSDMRAVIETLPSGWGSIVAWEPAPEPDATNPQLAGDVDPQLGLPWPAPLAEHAVVQEAAASVSARMAMIPRDTSTVMPAAGAAAPSTTVSTIDRAQVEQWDADLSFLVAEASERRASRRVVRLPDSVSASTWMRAQRDPASVAAELARPMPRPPSTAARRGTAFHSWVERRYGQVSLFDIDDLPGSADADRPERDLTDLQSAFERSPFANRRPVATEFPFAILVAGRVVRGRIDAVFEVPDPMADPAAESTLPRFDVVDWKTGHARGRDPMQLAIYRLAWARHLGIGTERIDAAFMWVETGEVFRPALPDLPD